MPDTRSVRVRISASLSDYKRELASGAAATRAFANELDTADSRMGNLVQTGLALGPALVPIAAAGVPAIAGLTSQLGFAVAAAGTTALAFQGMGDALTAVNDYSIDPTSENFAKLQEEMAKLGPAGREFVKFLNDLRPEMQKLQNVAQEGLFPGMQEGITELMDLMPQVERIVGNVARASGDLMAEAGDNLNDPRWREFFRFLEHEARPTLMATGRTIGNFTEGLANLWMSFGLMSADFSASLLRLSRDFSAWARGLDETQGFESFVQYIRDVGPQAWETLGALANALLGVVEAAAPVGKVVLPVVEALANGLAAVAKSDAGPMLIGAAAGLSAVSRAVALYRAANGSALMGMLGGVGTAARGVAAPTTAAATGLEKLNRAAAGLRTAGKVGAGIGGLAFVMSDLDDKMGVTNAAMGALMGSLAGPWGAAFGGAIGAVMDLNSANEGLEDSMERLDRATRAFDFSAMRSELGVLREEMSKEAGRGLGLDIATSAGAGMGLGPVIRLFSDFGEKADDASRKIESTEARFQQLRTGFIRMSQALEGEQGLTHASAGIKDLERMARTVVPALQEAGYSGRDISRILSQGPNGRDWDDAVGAVRRYVRAQDSVPGRTREVANAFRGLSSRLETTEDKAQALSSALDDLLGPELAQDEALVAWRRSLNGLQKELAQGRRTLNVNTKAGQDNRDSIRDRVEALTTSIKADAEAGVGAQRLAAKLRDGRGSIIAAGKAAGFSAGEMRRYLNQLGLTPKLVRTIIRAVDVDKSRRDVEAFIRKTRDVPKSIDAKVKGDTRDADRDLRVVAGKLGELDRTNAVPKAKLDDNASRDIDRVRRDVKDLDREKAVPKAELDGSKARRDVRSLRAYINRELSGIDNEQVAIDLNAQAQSAISAVSGLFSGGLSFVGGRNTGGSIPGWMGTPGQDSLLAMLTPDEHVVTDKEVAAAGKGDKRRGHRVWEGIRHAALIGALPDPMDLPKYNLGGSVGVSPSVGQRGVGSSVNQIERAFDAIADRIGSALSSKLNEALKFGGAGQPLGPGGTLSAGQLIRGQQFAKSQAGKPYVWGGVGPGGYDCSGFQSAVLNAAMGRTPYSRMGSTGTMPWPGMAGGVGRYTIGWFTGSPGHTSGNIAGLGVESRGGDGVVVGGGARSPVSSMFNSVGHYDNGGVWPNNTFGLNTSGGDEIVINPRKLARGGKAADGERAVEQRRQENREERRDDRREQRQEDREKAREKRQERREERREREQERRQLQRDRDRAQRRGLREFNVTGREDRPEMRQELGELRSTIREAFGKDSNALKVIRRMSDRLERNAAQAEKLRRSNEKISERGRALRESRRSYASEVAGNFRNDAFQGGLDDLRLQLSADTNDAQRSLNALRRADRKGLSGGLERALAASGNFLLQQQVANMSRREIARLERQFNERNRISGRLGDFAGNEVFGQRIRQNNRQLHRNERATHQNTRQMKRLGRVLERRVERRTGGARRRARSN